MNVYLGQIQIWQPDRRVSLSVALGLALLALGGFLLLLSQPDVSGSRPDVVSIQLHAELPLRRAGHRVRTGHDHRTQVAPTPSINTAAPPKLHRPALDLSIPVQPDYPAAFLSSKTAPSDRELQQTLNKPYIPASGLQEHQAYRSEAGETMVRSGDLCMRVHTVQMSPSPTNRATVGLLTPCPGGYRPTQGEQLLDWANRRAAVHPPP